MRTTIIDAAHNLLRIALIVGALPLLAAAQERLDRDAWISKGIMPKVGAKMEGEATDVDTTKWEIGWVSKDVKDDMLFVEGDAPKGWIKRDQILTDDEAIAYYTALIDHGEHLAWAYHMRAIVWKCNGKIDRAISDFGERLRIEPSAFIYDQRADRLRVNEEYDKAIADCDEAIALDPKNVRFYSTRAFSWLAKKEFDKAIGDCNQMIQLDPSNSVAYFCRGRAWIGKNESDKAIADFDEAIRLDPKYAAAYSDRGNLRESRKEYDKAIADYQHAAETIPYFAQLQNQVAWLQATCPDARYRDGERAVAAARKACRLSHDAFCIDTLAAAYAEAGNFKLAVEWQEEAIRLNSNDTEFVKGANDRLALYRAGKPYHQE